LNQNQQDSTLLWESTVPNNSTISDNSVMDVHPYKACKCLFGPVNHQEWQKNLSKEFKNIQISQSEKWNFDFARMRPYSGVWEWKCVGRSRAVLTDSRLDNDNTSNHSCIVQENINNPGSAFGAPTRKRKHVESEESRENKHTCTHMTHIDSNSKSLCSKKSRYLSSSSSHSSSTTSSPCLGLQPRITDYFLNSQSMTENTNINSTHTDLVHN